MQPIAVMPLHDPARVMLPLLESVTPQLKDLFACAIVSVTSITAQTQPDRVAALHADRYFQVIQQEQDLPVGEDFAALYAAAAASVSPSQVLHLCYIDRVAFALSSEHRAQFMADVRAVQPDHTPLVFHRSPAAWQTHPHNYQEIEPVVTLAGQWLFGVSLDFAWCHLALQAQQLAAVMPLVKRKDISMVAEMLLPLRHQARTREVDWLAWEDPFVIGCDAELLKREREASLEETHKRLAYVIPMLELLYQASRRERLT
jgi:hypothetical protein